MTQKNDVRAVLEGLGYTIPAADVYTHIALWRAWYRGYSPKFHDYTQYNGKSKVKRKRKALRMAKKVCEDHANLLMNEKVQITVDDKAVQEKIEAAFTANGFRVQANKLVEIAYALGAGAFVEHDDGQGNVLIDYVPADMIFPLSWDGETITECAFASVKTTPEGSFLYLNIHQLDSTGYVISNKLVPLDSTGGAKMSEAPGAKGKKRADEVKPDEDTQLLPGGVAPEVKTNSDTARFQIIGPNQVNNVDRGSPLGISVFANSLDLLEGIDLIFDSFCGEFRLGKKRIIIPITMLDLIQDGESTGLAFDDNDTEFYGMKDDKLTEIKEINMELRIDQHDMALQRFLNLLSSKTGLGNDRYKFDAGAVKTATEVVSEKSELFQNLKKNELVLEEALTGLCKAIAEISGIKTAFTTTINFDDSIIEDTDAKRNRIQVLVSTGKFPLWRYLHEYEGYTKEEAKAIAKEVEAATPKDVITYPDEPHQPGAAGGGSGGEPAAGGDPGGGDPSAE